MTDELLTQSQEAGALLLCAHSLTAKQLNGNTSSPNQYDRRKRDSGYCTDFSPGLGTKGSRRFTFDSDCDGSEFELSGEFGNLDIDNDVFEDDTVSDIDIQYDDADKEVEDLLSKSGELGQTNYVSKSLKIDPFRPAAPIQSLREDWDDHSENDSAKGDDSGIVCNSFCQKHQVLIVENICKHCKISNFRPISRNTETALPGLHGHTVHEATGGLAKPRFQPYMFSKAGCAAHRLRLRLDNEAHGIKGPLPDVVPVPRDRSVSLPEISGLKELEIGRELRRISDEFDSALNKAKKRQSRRNATYFLI